MVFLRINYPDFGLWMCEVSFKDTQFDIVKDAQVNFSDTQFV